MFVTQSAHRGSCSRYAEMISSTSRQGRTGAPYRTQSVEQHGRFFWKFVHRISGRALRRHADRTARLSSASHA